MNTDGGIKLLPCPFCGSNNIDAEGWASTDRKGPACDDCSGCADTVELWNSRPFAALAAQMREGTVPVAIWWLHHVRYCLQGPLPAGKIGDAVFLLREQIDDLLTKAATPTPTPWNEADQKLRNMEVQYRDASNRAIYLEETMREVSAMLKVPAAEYVLAMGDAFSRLDRALTRPDPAPETMPKDLSDGLPHLNRKE